MENSYLPIGKLPNEILRSLFSRSPISDRRVVIGPGIGLDCAIVENGEKYLVFKTDPITFATELIGWYAIQVAANDIFTSGGTPKWYLATILLPEKKTTNHLIEDIYAQLSDACEHTGISLIGGHTEITFGLDRPIICGTMIGEVSKNDLLSAKYIKPTDRVLLTKTLAIETTAILAHELSQKANNILNAEEMEEAKNFLFKPGISIMQDARLAHACGGVTAMHDVTEGGLLSGLWELAEASQNAICFQRENVKTHPISQRLCDHFNIDPLSTISSGALLITVTAGMEAKIIRTLEESGIPCAEIGSVEQGNVSVFERTMVGCVITPRPARDAITQVFETKTAKTSE